MYLGLPESKMDGRVVPGGGGGAGAHLREVPGPASVMAGAVLHVLFGLGAAAWEVV